MANNKIHYFKYLDDLIHSGVKEIVLDSDVIYEDTIYNYEIIYNSILYIF